MRDPVVIMPAPLSREAFAPFGSVVRAGGEARTLVNQGRAWRHDGLAGLVHDAEARRPTLALYAVQASRLPFALRLLERHPLSSQVFLPMQGSEYLVVVAPDASAGVPDIAYARAFRVGPGTGIEYRPGVWHAPIIALEGEALFAMLTFEAGGDRDTQEILLATPILIQGS